MDAAARLSLARGDNEVAPTKAPWKTGMQHFHDWYREAMGTATPKA